MRIQHLNQLLQGGQQLPGQLSGSGGAHAIGSPGGDGGSGGGGGLYAAAGPLDIANSRIASNRATGGPGGAGSDWRGEAYPRIVGGTIDIGAFEAQIGAAVAFQVDAPPFVLSGVPFDVTVAALDAHGHIASLDFHRALAA